MLIGQKGFQYWSRPLLAYWFWHTEPVESSAPPGALNLTGRSRPIGARPGPQGPSVTAGGASSVLLPACLGNRLLEQARFGFFDGAALTGRSPQPTARTENHDRLEAATGNRAGQEAATRRQSPCVIALHSHHSRPAAYVRQ